MTRTDLAQRLSTSANPPAGRYERGLTLVGISMVRDEVDIIDEWLDHTLGVLDGLVVVAHNCTDGTLERLVARAKAGAPLAVLAQNAETFRQGETLTEVARTVAGRFCPDWVFALDADEFIGAESRAALEDALRALPPATAGLLPWRTYLPPLPGPGAVLDRAVRCLEQEPAPQCKVVIPYGALADPSVVVVEGSHGVAHLRAGGLVPLAHAVIPGAHLAHLPVRSEQQLRRKVSAGEAAIRRLRPEGSPMAWHWAELAARFQCERPLSSAALEDIALRYYAFAEPAGPCQSLPAHRVARVPIGCPAKRPPVGSGPRRAIAMGM